MTSGNPTQRRVQHSATLSRPAAEKQAQQRGREAAKKPPSPRLQHQLRAVRIHDDAEGARIAEEEHARAVTIGQDIYFNRGEYAPDTSEGQSLLAHEQVHTEQQATGQVPQAPQHEPKKEPKLGLGSTPPEVDFTQAEGPANETEHVLFPYDSNVISGPDLKKISAWAKSQFMPVIVEVHGYASHEGADVYNLNLSAHRALAVKRAIELELPLGSEVQLIAHGETGNFEKPEENRRVGLEARMKPLTLSAPPLGKRQFGQPSPTFKYGITPNPSLFPPAPPITPLVDPNLLPKIKLDPEPPKIDLKTPGFSPYVPKYPQWTAPQLYPFPSQLAPEPYWPNIADSFNERGVPMGPGDADVMRRLATQNLGLLNSTEGLYGGPYNWARRNLKFLDLDSLDVAKPKWAASLAGAAASAQLKGDHPTATESANRDALKYGLPDPTIIPLPSLSFDLNSKAVKQSQDAAKRRDEEAKKQKENQ